MRTLIIENDNGVPTSYVLTNSNVVQSDDSLILQLYTTEDICIQYKIFADDREKDIKQISQFLSNQLSNSSAKNNELKLTEYLLRHYIYIGEASERRQFTASKLP